MTNITNLNRFRKKKARFEKEQRSDENRAKFGRTKAEKSRDHTNAEKLKAHLDDHRLQDEE